MPREKKRQGMKLIPRDLLNVDRSILLTETEVKFCTVLHAVRVRSTVTTSSKQQLISDDQCVCKHGKYSSRKMAFAARQWRKE